MGKVKELRDTSFLLGHGIIKGDLKADYPSVQAIETVDYPLTAPAVNPFTTRRFNDSYSIRVGATDIKMAAKVGRTPKAAVLPDKSSPCR